MRDFTNVMKMDLDTRGVIVQASTLGALEALMQFLRKECDPPIPVRLVYCCAKLLNHYARMVSVVCTMQWYPYATRLLLAIASWCLHSCS
jgi:hypothetical protein